MRTVLPIAGGFYESDSRPLSSQDCVNYHPHVTDQPALANEVLYRTPGLYQVGTAGTSGGLANRGARAIGQSGRPYFVQGQNLYRLEADNTMASLGTIAGSGRVSMDDNGTQLFILVPGGKGYIFTENPDTLTEITDGDFSANGKPQQVVFIDGYFVCTTDEKKFIISALNDGTSWNALDFGSAESSPDGVVTPFVYRNQLFIGGERSTEAFTNIGGADFPFQRTGLFLDEGVQARFSVVKAKNSIIFIGAGENEGPGVYELRDNATTKISTKAIDRLLQGLSEEELGAVFAWFYSQRGHFFTGFVLPKTTIVYDSATNRWHERQSRIANDGVWEFIPWRASSLVTVAGVTYAGDSRDGRVGILDPDTYEEYESTIVRWFSTMPFQSNMRPFFVPQLELTVESGVGLRKTFSTQKYYSPLSYKEKLVEVVEKGSDGGVWVFDEDDANDNAQDCTTFGNDLSDFGSPSVLNPSFLDDGLYSTLMDSSNSYRDLTATFIALSGTFGVAYDHDDANALAVMDIRTSGSDFIVLNFISSSQMRITVTANSGSNQEVINYSGSFSGVNNFIIKYALEDGGTEYTVELFQNFVSLGSTTGNVSAGTFSLGGGPDILIPGTGSGDGYFQYGFYSDRQVTASDISELEDAWNQAQVGYVDPSPSNPTPDSSIDPVIRLQVSRDGGHTFSDERERKIGKIGEYDKRAIWRRLGRSKRYDVYRWIFSEPTECAILQLTADIEGEDVAAA